ncbi:MAG: metallophosphoesterase [Promethearchaeota archaeon]
MKLGVMSDSHDNIELIEKAVEYFNANEIPVVVHCGDLISPFIARIIEKLDGKFYGVFGNNDGERVGLAKFFTKDTGPIVGNVFDKEIGGRRVIAFHGHNHGPDLIGALAKSGQFSAILSGHTHQVVNEKVGDTLVVNPGEVCGYLTGRSTVAVVDLDALEAEIVTLKDGLDHL